MLEASDIRKEPAESVDWYEDHRNLALVAEWMSDNGHDNSDIVYMLEKPWKFLPEYHAAVKEQKGQ